MTATAKKAPVKRAPPKPKTETPSVKVPGKKAPAKPKAVRKPATPKVKKPIGRPTDFSEALCEEICMQLAEGKSLTAVCADEAMPHKSTVFRWLYRHKEFRDRYAYAKEISAYAIEEEAYEIADDGRNDWMEVYDKDGNAGYKINGEHVQRSRLRVDTRKWFMERIAAKRFGNKVDVNHGIQENNPITTLMGQMAGKVLKPVAEHE
jgi:hypothetical protein